jgi:multimeric flavodoxin WrbA
MKAIAINASPKMDKGNTAAILRPFLDGMREAGAEVEVFYAAKMKINPCQGDLACWFKTPGRCAQKDDMEMLLPKLASADILVFATPVYVDGMPGPLKNVIDRCLPLVTPFVELRDGHSRHTSREGTIPSKVVLVSSCGLWEIDNFDPLLTYLKAICRNMKREFAGALLRPHCPAFKSMVDKGEPVDDILDSAREAGHELVRTGSISSQSLTTVKGRRDHQQARTGFHLCVLGVGQLRFIDCLHERRLQECESGVRRGAPPTALSGFPVNG